MRTMSGGPCLYYDCSNKNSFGYCKTTACINERYQQEQWGLPSTSNKSESVVIKQQTNADRIRAMSDEDLATWLCDVAGWLPAFEGMVHPILEWLRQEVNK